MLSVFAVLAVLAGDIPTEARVVSVYDGDTVTLDTGDKIRLRLVNTPEMKPYEDYAREAKRLTESLVLNRTVKLAVNGADARDGYGRILARIETSRGDLSLALVQAGLAHVFIIPPESDDVALLLEAQRVARESGRGIWSNPRYQGALHFTSFHANGPGDDRENVNGEYLRVANVTVEPINLQGYTIQNARGERFTLPDLVVPAGHTFRLHSGKGGHQGNPEYPLEVFLGSDHPVWNNAGDRAILEDPTGRVVDIAKHAPKSSSP